MRTFRPALLCTLMALCATAALAQSGPKPDLSSLKGTTADGSPEGKAESRIPIVYPKQSLDFLKLPNGRHMGEGSSITGDSHGNIWIAERCGANDCTNSPLDPVVEFDSTGKFIKAFGKGKILFPHNIVVDKNDHVWVVDGHGNGKIGNDVLEFDQSGKVLLTLGKPGGAGDSKDQLNQPSSVVVAPNGDIFVGDGHTQVKGNARIVKYNPSGKFLMQWGQHGHAPGDVDVPHCMTMDSQGRLYVGDRGNDRIDIFDQNGKFIKSWTQFGRPSGCLIDSNDILYVSDSDSPYNDGAHHPGWARGIRMGSVKDGLVTMILPIGPSAPEALWVDKNGAILGAETSGKAVIHLDPPK